MPNRTYLRLVMALAVLAMLWQAQPAAADGCVVADRSVWARLSEGHQIAVVRLESTQRATVDLFISLLDAGESAQEVSFVVPLGVEAGQFAASEETLDAFEEALTHNLDAAIRQSARQAAGYARDVRLALLLGTLFVNGGWSWPIWLALLSSGCSALGEPIRRPCLRRRAPAWPSMPRAWPPIWNPSSALRASIPLRAKLWSACAAKRSPSLPCALNLNTLRRVRRPLRALRVGSTEACTCTGPRPWPFLRRGQRIATRWGRARDGQGPSPSRGCTS